VNPSSVLVTRHDKIGDFVLALPLCKAIKAQYPAVRLSVLVSPVNEDFAREISFVDEVICYRKESSSAALKRLRQISPQASISCFIDMGLGWLLWRSRISRRIAPATKLAQFFFSDRIKQRRSQVAKPEFIYNIELGKALFPDLKMEYGQPLLDFRCQARPQKSIIAFHPGFGGSSDGNLQIEDYLRLARRAAENPNIDVVFTFGPDDRELREQVRALLDFPARIIDGFPSLRAFCEFLQGCTLFVSTSTGPMHLAAAVNISTLSFFGASLFASSARWQPVSEPNRQHNFMLDANYSDEQFHEVEQALIRYLQ
jgi:ADP-heptose:LPS heptosyltransferase